MPIDIGGALAGVGSFLGNQVSSAINSSRAWKYSRLAMEYQDKLNRAYTRDSYGIMRQGLEQAGYNPLLALGSSANSSIYSGSGINSDSDAGDQAITSAVNALSAKANIKNVNAQTDKINEEKKGIELENRLKRKQLNTDPKAVVSDLLEDQDTPTVRFLRKVGEKLGISTGGVNSSVSSQKKSIPIVLLHDGNPYVQKGVPNSVVKSFNGYNSSVSVLDKLPRKYKIYDIKHSEGRSYKKGYYNNFPPKNFPSGM